jgi:hypothetical protein
MNRFRLIALALSGLLVLAACGSDSEDASSKDTTGSDLSDVEDVAEFFSNDNCVSLSLAMAYVASPFVALTAGQTDDVAEYEKLFKEFRDNVPDDIESEVEVMIEANDEFAQTASELEIDLSTFDYAKVATDPALQTKLGELSQKASDLFDAAEYKAASAKVQTYLEDECKV